MGDVLRSLDRPPEILALKEAAFRAVLADRPDTGRGCLDALSNAELRDVWQRLEEMRKLVQEAWEPRPRSVSSMEAPWAEQ